MAAIAALDMGAYTSPRAMPNSRYPGRTSPYPESSLIRVMKISPATPQIIPAVIKPRAPTRAINLPARGEIKIIGAVTGRISSPVAVAECPRAPCRY